MKESGDTAEGVYVMFMAEQTDYLNFNKKYKERFGEEPSAYSKYAYDGALALIKAIEKTRDVKANLHSIEFNGASGKVAFDSVGDRTGVSYDIYVVKKGSFVKV